MSRLCCPRLSSGWLSMLQATTSTIYSSRVANRMVLYMIPVFINGLDTPPGEICTLRGGKWYLFTHSLCSQPGHEVCEVSPSVRRRVHRRGCLPSPPGVGTRSIARNLSCFRCNTFWSIPILLSAEVFPNAPTTSTTLLTLHE